MTEQQPSEPIENKVQRMQTEFDRRTNILLDEIVFLRDGMQVMTRQVTQLAEGQQRLQENQQLMQSAIVNLSNLVGQLIENSITDRAETRRIWEYLESQQRIQGNGHGG